jgi:hypothetical protein
LHVAQPPLDMAVIRFDPVIAVPAASLTEAPISCQCVRRPVIGFGQCLFQEQLGSFVIPCLGARAFSSAEEYLSSDCVNGTGCLILDIAMPGMTGFDLQRELQLRGQKIPIIFITAQTMGPSGRRLSNKEL